MKDLIMQLQKAAGPDHRLDHAIHVAMEGNTVVPRYTESVDAALLLVPAQANGYGFEREQGCFVAYVQRNFVNEGHWHREGEHPTSPAIAFCIAALKAREDHCGVS